LQGENEEVGLTLVPPSRYRSILVPVDGGAFGEHALSIALGIARRAGAEVQVVNVYCPPQSASRPELLHHDGGLEARLVRDRQAYLDDLLRRLRKVTSVPVTQVLVQSRDIVGSLAEASAGADLVVMAIHRRGMLGRCWYGSVADRLMRRLSIPFLLVRGYHSPADLTGDPHLRRVLIPLDGSEFAEKVLDPALALGTLTDAEHTLLRVLPLETDYAFGYGGATQFPPSGQRSAEAREYLRSVANRLRRGTLRVQPRIVLDEQPTPGAILQYAQSHEADLIALATHGREGLARLFRGSIADRVVRGASVPVLVFRPDS
jgi:nucleotide-binding universal stress UspA family protein